MERSALKYRRHQLLASLHWCGAWGDTCGGKLALRAGGRRQKYWYPLLISIPEKLLPITRIKDDDDRRLDGQLGRWPHVDGESVLATVALSVLSAFIGIVIILIIDIIITVVVIISLSSLPSSAQILLRLDFSAFMCLVLGSLGCMWLLFTLGGTHYWDGQVKIIRFFVQQK